MTSLLFSLEVNVYFSFPDSWSWRKYVESPSITLSGCCPDFYPLKYFDLLCKQKLINKSGPALLKTLARPFSKKADWSGGSAFVLVDLSYKTEPALEQISHSA